MKLLFYVEGQTEEAFVEKILCPHFTGQGFECDHPILAANSTRNTRGGLGRYLAVKDDITNLLEDQDDPDIRLITLVDLYALPSDFPRPSHLTESATGREKATAFADAWQTDIADDRFIAFLFSHEFEALILSEPYALRVIYPGSDRAIEALEREIIRFDGPEDINDSPQTAPSRLIRRHLPRYRKVVGGVQAIEEIGLDRIRCRCPHFNELMGRLENL